MNNIIIGTAGHIDHGKTTLIKALTGRETDRLKQEKNRGISIELGFTYFDLPSGRRAGIIDVPGHEKFIKNMLAGVSGMDIVVLVIAADEGVMPQTKEHLHILNMLDIKEGITVITKADLVDDEWLELVKEDVKENLQDSFLDGKPMMTVSSTNKEGINELVNYIDKLTSKVNQRDETDIARLPVDRVFTLTGFGTIVTGTLVSGLYRIGDEVRIYPGDKIGRIRSIQIHGEDVQEAYPGSRVAINLAGLKKSDIQRGNVVAPIDSMKTTMMLDVRLKLLKESQRIIENRTRVRLYLGTNEILCRVVLLDKEYLTPGESCYAQLRLEEKTVAKRGDKFIIRFYSPMTTIGGGEILEANPQKRKRFDKSVIDELKLKEKGEIDKIIEDVIKQKSEEFPTINKISLITVIQKNKVKKQIENLRQSNKIIVFSLSDEEHVIHKTYYELLTKQILDDLNNYHNENPLKEGVLKEEIRSRYLGDIKAKIGDMFIDKLIDSNLIKQEHENISIKDFNVEFNDLQESIKNEIESKYLSEKYSFIKQKDIINDLDYNINDIKQVFNALIDMDILVRLKEDIIMHKKVYNDIIDIVKQHIKENNKITVAEFRDLLNTSRKYAIAILEDFDQKKITKRIGNERVLY